MFDFLFLIAMLLFVAWLLGVFALSAPGFIHLLLVLSFVALLFRLIRGRPL